MVGCLCFEELLFFIDKDIPVCRNVDDLVPSYTFSGSTLSPFEVTKVDLIRRRRARRNVRGDLESEAPEEVGQKLFGLRRL
jgi:hypothetical protein